MAVFIENLGTLPTLLAGLRIGCGTLLLLAGLSQCWPGSGLVPSLIAASPLGITLTSADPIIRALGLAQCLIGILLTIGYRTRLCSSLFTLWAFLVFFLLLGGRLPVLVPDIGYVSVPIPTAVALQALLVLVPAGTLLTFSRSAGLTWGLDALRSRRRPLRVVKAKQVV